MRLVAINGFLLPTREESNKIKIEQYAGFLSRKSRVFIQFKNPNECKLLDHKNANHLFMTWVMLIFGEKSEEYRRLNNYKTKLENLNTQIDQLGKKLIDDYNHENYNINPLIYNTKPQLCLMKLEQLFIQNELPSCYLEELTKPKSIKIQGRNAFNWISNITKLKIEKVKLLKEYLDEYFQYLLDRPKSIWSINNLLLPISEFDRKQILLNRQYASYLNRNTEVFISYFNNSQLVTNKQSNDGFMSWFRSICNENDKQLELENYRYNIENLSESVINLGKKIVENYNYDRNNVYTEKQQCLINLEQFLIRYNLPPEYIMDSIEKKKVYIHDDDAMDWINKITKRKKERTKNLIKYMEEYFKHVFNQSKNEKIINSNKTVEILGSKKINNKYKTI